MKIRTHSLITLLCAATASLLIVGPAAQAGFTVTLQQVGPNVVATGSGAIDLTGLSSFGSTSAGPEMYPAHGIMGTGPFGAVDLYAGLSGPASFGHGFGGFASTGSGDSVFLEDFGISIEVPQGYVSGTNLSDSATYSGTFASLHVTPGTYEWTWGTGVNQNYTLIIPAAAVPDSGSTIALLFLVLGALFGARCFRCLRLAD